MTRLLKIWLPVIVVLGLFQGSQGRKPDMTPSAPEIYINEGEPLELTCTSSNPMKFYYPKTVPNEFETSNETIDAQTSHYTEKLIFRRSETVRGDTGFYGCADVDVDVTPDTYDEPNVRWTYVYVQSNTSFFVRSDVLKTIRVAIGGDFIAPCRPTSPRYEVKLAPITGNHEEIVESTTFDPRIGFKLAGVMFRHSDYYQCSIQVGDETQEMLYQLIVMRQSNLEKPVIQMNTLKHVTRGQILYVNCSTISDRDLTYSFTWTTPQRDSRIKTREYKQFKRDTQIITLELKIEGVIDEDEGEYVCAMKTFSGIEKTKAYIKVYDPAVKYINLTSHDLQTQYVAHYGERVQWTVNVVAYPQPKLKWLNPYGGEITGTWDAPETDKYAVNNTLETAILRINRLLLRDMGLYSLQATNEDRMETMNFSLVVIAKPIMMIENIKKFYMPKQKVKIICNVAAYPEPNVTWSFMKAPNYPDFEGSKIVELEDFTVEGKHSVFHSVLTMTIDMSGHLTCTGCNDDGCDSYTDVILVSDVSNGFGIIETKKQVTEGDDVDIICAASLYNYTSVEWLDRNDSKILATDRISISRTSTYFTDRSILRLKNVQRSDNGSFYVCGATDADNKPEREEYTLFVHHPMAPVITETNMNKTTIAIDLNTEGHKTVVFKCHVQGMPKPNVTWYKDDVRIRTNEQFECRHDNQELYIKYLLDENSGRYTCKAVNRFGIDENYQTILIKVKEVSKALIISIVVLVVICVILVIYFSIKMHREKVMRKQLMEAGLTHFEEGALECLNPDLTVDDQAELLPYDKKWEFPRERLKFGKQLGFGAFGVVMKAEAQGICDDEAVTTVAVKMVRRSTESTYIRALASELKIMVHLGKHLNVVNLLGACTKNITKRELLVIVEYCRFGNLHNYLLRHRADFINQIDPATRKLDPTIGHDILTRTTSVGSNNRIKYAALSFSRSLSANSCNSNPNAELVSYTTGTDSQGVSMSPDGCVLSNNSTQPGWRSNYRGDYKDQNLKPICTQDLLSWAFQVARGMEYLSQRKVLHGDLAARNILLAENNIVKICDFGLAKTMYKDDNYKKKGDAPLPIKWMAIESIRDRVFSTQSDIWSFGIVLWEFFTLAKTPYPGMEAEKQYQRLIEGYRMEQPEYATDEVYDIMLQCWKAKPTARPTFTHLVSGIGDLLEESVKAHYVDLNAPYIDMNTIVLESGKSDYLTMMSAPDHDALVSPNDYVNSPSISPGSPRDDSYIPMSPSIKGADSGIFSPRITSNSDKFEFPSSDVKSSVHSDSESEAVELSPMLKHDDDDDNYLKPINVHERRAEFARQRQAMKNSDKTEKPRLEDLGYCNDPRRLRLIDAKNGTPATHNFTDVNNRQEESCG